MNRYIGQDLEGPQTQNFCPSGAVMPQFFWHVDVFTNLEALQTLCFGDFCAGLLHKYAWLLTTFLVHLPSPKNGEWGWKFWVSNYGLVFLVTRPFLRAYQKSSQTLKQKIPITQKIAKNLGALCQRFLSLRKLQEFGQRANISRNQGQYYYFTIALY